MAAFLEDEGYRVLARNWTGAGAELDLIVVRDGCVRFVEVKARKLGDETALESIGSVKQRRLRRGAEAWMRDHVHDEVAFMVAVVTLDPAGWSLELIDDAF